jgi:hypothetical protein
MQLFKSSSRLVRWSVVFLACAIGSAFAFAHVRMSNLPRSSATDSDGLRFDVRTIVLDNSFPGLVTGTVVLRNHSHQAIQNIHIVASCHCVTPKTSYIPAIQPNQAISIPFQVDTGSRTENRQLIGAYIGAQPSVGDAVSIVVHPLPPFSINTFSVQMPPLVREFPSASSSSTMLMLPLRAGVTVTSIASEVSWLSLSEHPQGQMLAVVARTNGYAPEGPYDAGFTVQFYAHGKKINCELRCSGSVRSVVEFSPHCIFWGGLKRGVAASPQTVQFRSDEESLPTSLAVASPSSRVRCRILSKNPHEVLVSVSLDHAEPGELETYVRLSSGVRTIAAVPISAFVQ